MSPVSRYAPSTGWTTSRSISDRLHREQRYPLRVAGDLRLRLGRHPRHERVHQRVHRRRIQRIQGQRVAVAAGAEPRPGLGQLRAGEHHQVDGQVPGPVDQVVQEVQQAGVGVLGVLDQQHHRLGRGQPLEEQPPSREQLLPGQGRGGGVCCEGHSEQAS